LYYSLQTLPQRVEVIAALGDECDSPFAQAAGGASELRHDSRVAGGRHPQSGERIQIVRVESRGDEDQFRHETIECRDDDLAIFRVNLGVGCAGRQGHVDRVALPRAGTGLGRGAGARVIRILMARDVQHRRVFVERRLRAVAVMHVDVDDGDA
jgi:hypothetical protein